MTLFDLIMEGQRLIDAIASHPDYARLQEGNYLTNHDFTLADFESFLMQLNQSLLEMTEPETGNNYPSFEEIFGEGSLSNSLVPLEPTITPVISIEERS
jgi:hypothetical protein